MMKFTPFYALLAFVIVSLLSACGGGGGGGTSSSGGSTSGSSGSSSGGNGAAPTASGTFTIETNKLAFTTYEYEEIGFIQDIVGRIDQLSEDLYVIVDATRAPMIDSADVILSEVELAGTLTLQTVASNTLQPGTHYGEIRVSACTSPSCERHYKGSPASVDVIFSVLPNDNPDVNCEDQYGVVFDECVDPDWMGGAAWEREEASGVQLKHTDGGNPERILNWRTLDTGEPGYGRVLEVEYNKIAGQGAFRFPAAFDAVSGQPVEDMRRFANGTLEFDVRVLNWANASDLVASVECFWPCASGFTELGIGGSSGWQHIALEVQELVETGLNLETVSTGLLIGTPSGSGQNGLIYQLDNVRWVPGVGDPLEGETEYALDAASMDVVTLGNPSYIDWHTSPELVLEPGWSAIDDQIFLNADLGNVVGFGANSRSSIEVVVPASYSESKVFAQMLVTDAGGRRAYGSAEPLAVYADDTLTLSMDDYSNADEFFDLSQASKVGVRLFFQDQGPDTNAGELIFRNLTVRVTE